MKFFVTSDVLNVDVYKDIFFNLLKEESKPNVAMDGKWLSHKSTKAGIEIDVQKISTELIIDKYFFTLKESNAVESGYIHYLNFNQNKAINLYFFDAENKYLQTAYCLTITKDDGAWIICSNYENDERPTDFVSTVENKFFLEEFVRV